MCWVREYLVTSKHLLWPAIPGQGGKISSKAMTVANASLHSHCKALPRPDFLDWHLAKARTQTTREFGKVFPATDVIQELA